MSIARCGKKGGTEMSKIFIGVDPDVDRNGVAMWDKETKTLSLQKLKFFELYEFLAILKHNRAEDITVVIEAGWLNKKSNWHTSGKGEFVAGRIGTKVGANHETGKKIVEMCEYMGLKYELRQPTSSKMGIRQFRMITKYQGKVDQDMVDAALLVYQR